MATTSTVLEDGKYNYEDEVGKFDVTESTGKVLSQPVPAYKSRTTSVVSIGGDQRGDREMFSCLWDIDGERFCYRWGVAVDDQSGNIYVSEYRNNRILVLNCNGEYLYKFEENINCPCSIAISQNQVFVFVSQCLSHCVSVYDLTGTFITHFGGMCYVDSQSVFRHGLSISKINGDIYVCDDLKNRIELFSEEFPLIFQFGQGILKNPCDIQLTNESIFVLSSRKPFLYSFSYDFIQTHNFALSSICKHLEYPLAFCIDGSGHFIMSDWGQDAIVIFNQQGEFVHRITDRVQFPRGIALDSSKGRIIVVRDTWGLIMF